MKIRSAYCDSAHVVCILFALVLFPLFASAQEWSVAPIKLEFAGGTTSGIITINNDSSNQCSYQMKAFEWLQDKDGKDVYIETNDIVFYPRIMSIEPKDQRLIRAGMKIPRGEKEKTYRLFIEDITRPERSKDSTGVNFAIRFGVPIFFKPLKEEVRGALESLTIDKGIITIPVRNTGNSHFIVQKITVSGSNQENDKVFSKELSGWYTLAGTVKSYTMEIPQEICSKLTRIDIEAKTNRFTMKESLNVQRKICIH